MGLFWDSITEFIEEIPFTDLDNDQDDFVLYMDLTRRLSWDIPSALSCPHPESDDVPMHRDPVYWPEDFTDRWPAIDQHHKEAHGLDLTDSRINWSFDT
jgi:hypothetical protein